VIALAVFLTLAGVIVNTTWLSRGDRPMNPTTAEIGELLMKDYVLPFEIASVFLLIALIGAAMIVRRDSE